MAANNFTLPIEMLKPWIEYLAGEFQMSDQLCYTVYNQESAQWAFTPSAELIIKILSPDYKLEMSNIYKYPGGRHAPALYKTMQICGKLDIYSVINADGTYGPLSWTELRSDFLPYIQIEIGINDGRFVEFLRVNKGDYRISKITKLIRSGQVADRNNAPDDLRSKIAQILAEK